MRENKRGTLSTFGYNHYYITHFSRNSGVATLTAENGLLNKTNESAFITEMKGYQEATRIYVMEQRNTRKWYGRNKD